MTEPSRKDPCLESPIDPGIREVFVGFGGQGRRRLRIRSRNVGIGLLAMIGAMAMMRIAQAAVFLPVLASDTSSSDIPNQVASIRKVVVGSR